MRRFIVILLGVVLSAGLAAQSVKELQQRKQKAMKNLEITSGLITENTKTTKNALSKVSLLSAEIKQRRTVINSLNSEINGLNRQMSRLRTDIALKEKQLTDVKNEYAALMYHRYFKKSRYQKVMFVLSASSFAESYRRYRYLKEYAGYCEKKASEIKEIKADLDARLLEVETVRQQRAELLGARKKENAQLQTEKNKQNTLVRQLKKKDKELRQQLKKQQAAADKLNAQIEAKIAEEAAKSSSKTASTGKTKGSSGAYQLTKEETLLSGNFEKNQGRLPWPVDKGVVTGSFGIQPHPVLDRVTVNNKGIYIQCPAGTKARAVFEGEVTQCFAIPGSNNAVIVKHGLYRTVYANLGKVLVKVGDKVSVKQTIGTIYSDAEDNNKTELYFQVWKDKVLQNPELWLSK